jgi:small subunit ribosomal protein S30e
MHTLEVPGQETVNQVKAHVASPRRSVVLLAGTPLEEEATVGRCGEAVLTTLEGVGHEPGGKVHGSLACAGKVKQEEKNPGREKWWNQHLLNSVSSFDYKKGHSANS